MLSKKILIPLTVVLLSAPAVFADSGDRTAVDQKMHGAGMLNLTEEQQTALRELMQAQRKVLGDNLLALRAAGERLRITFQSSGSEEEIRIQAAALSALKAKIDAARLDHQIAVWQVLTPDQRLLMPQQGRRPAILRGYQQGKGEGHRGFRGHSRGKDWDNKHSMNWKKSSVNKWRKNRRDSDSKKEY